MTVSVYVPSLRGVADDIRKSANPVAEAADELHMTAAEISKERDAEALKKDGYDRTLEKAATFLLERVDRIKIVADSVEELANIVEHYEREVINTLPGAAVEEAVWGDVDDN